jgi:hypothetical protein
MKYLILVIIIILVIVGIAPLIPFLAPHLECLTAKYPAPPIATTSYKGSELPLYHVPIDGHTQIMALLKRTRTHLVFIDPRRPEVEVRFRGNWRGLRPVYTFIVDEWLCNLRFSTAEN